MPLVFNLLIWCFIFHTIHSDHSFLSLHSFQSPPQFPSHLDTFLYYSSTKKIRHPRDINQTQHSITQLEQHTPSYQSRAGQHRNRERVPRADKHPHFHCWQSPENFNSWSFKQCWAWTPIHGTGLKLGQSLLTIITSSVPPLLPHMLWAGQILG